MRKEKNNFARAVEWLRDHGKIKNQKDLAMRIGVTETTITRNKRGNVRCPDDETLRKFNKAFGSIINIAYLRDESNVMLVEDLKERREIYTGVNFSPTPPLDTLAAALIAAKEETIAALKSQLSEKDSLIAAKDTLISALQQQVNDLRSQVSAQKGHSNGTSRSEAAEHGTVRVMT